MSTLTASSHLVGHFIGGRLHAPRSAERLPVTNPASGAVMAELPLASADEVEDAISAAEEASHVWREVPLVERARVLFRFRQQIEEHRAELIDLIVADNGKTRSEAAAEMGRALESVEFATGVPTHSLGSLAEQVSHGVDVEVVRQPLGVVAALTPFNFPVMVPLWMAPMAIACGNAFVLKPSERTPLAAVRLAELFAECGAPSGVFNVVHGTRDVAQRLIADPRVAAISVVGSTPVARDVYAAAAAHGKRVQALGGAKNSLIVMPDADLKASVDSITASAFGCAGQRCLAGSNVIAVGSVAEPLVARLVEAASALRLGDGNRPETTLGPVITRQSRQRIVEQIDLALGEGARAARDGRGDRVEEFPEGYFLGPTILDQVYPDMAVAREELFGPVLSVIHVRDLDEALGVLNSSPFGNSASVYTTSGHAAREFRRRAETGMLGINVGVPAPVAFFSFGGWKESFFGDLHVQGPCAVEYYTRRKVVTSRW